GPGNDTISAFLPASTVAMNVLAGGSPAAYPPANAFPTTAQFEAQFVSYATGDYRLIATSPWHGAGTDGLDLGAIVSDVAEPTPAPSSSTGASGPRNIQN